MKNHSTDGRKHRANSAPRQLKLGVARGPCGSERRVGGGPATGCDRDAGKEHALGEQRTSSVVSAVVHNRNCLSRAACAVSACILDAARRLGASDIHQLKWVCTLAFLFRNAKAR